MKELTKDDYDFIVDCLNEVWHNSNNQLLKQLGNIERENYAYRKEKCYNLMKQIEKLTT